MKRQLICGDYIDSQYYNPKYGVKGNRVLTKDICEICYVDEDIVLSEEIYYEHDVGGKNQFLVCIYCFDMNIKITCFGGPTNKK